MAFQAAANSQSQAVIVRNGDKIAGKPPGLVRGIAHRNYPSAIQHRWPRGGMVFVRLLIEPNGRPSECSVIRSFGDAEADRWTCKLVTERGRFRPAVNERGERLAAWYGYVQAHVDLLAR